MPEQLQLSKPAASVDIATGTKNRIAAVRKVAGKLTPEQDAVLALLEAAHAPDARLSQRDIARSAAWLGCHPKHEAEVVANEWESTTRQVRDIIRQLRIEHQIPVLSDRGGYFLPSSQGEADSYIKRMESEAMARAAASMVTYNVMKHTLGVTSAFFEAIAAVDAPKVQAACEHKETTFTSKGKTCNQCGAVQAFQTADWVSKAVDAPNATVGFLQTGKADLADKIAENISGAMQRHGFGWPLHETAELFRMVMKPDGSVLAKGKILQMLRVCGLRFDDVVRNAGGAA